MVAGLVVPTAGPVVLLEDLSVPMTAFTGRCSDLTALDACLIVPEAGRAVSGDCFSTSDDTTLTGLDDELPAAAALTEVELRSRLTLLEDATPLRTDVPPFALVPPFTLVPVASRLEPALGLSSIVTVPW